MPLRTDKKIELLKNLDFLAEQELEVYRFLSTIVDELIVKKGDTIFTKGDLGGAAYVIDQGIVQIHDEGHVFIELGHGKSFGEYAFVKTEERSASARAKYDTLLLKCTEDHIKQVESKFGIEIIDFILIPLQNIKKRMLVKDLLEEELTKQKATIEKQRKELESLNATKDKFFSIIAHDLKNPFASLIGASDILVDGADKLSNKQVKTFSKIINQSARQAFRLLENLLSWSRMQTGTIAFQPKKIDLWNLIHEVVILHTPSAEFKDICLEAIVEEDLYVIGDENMLNTIIRNLVSNAIKFTPRGGTITVSSRMLNKEIELWVSDSGIGIEAENQRKLFSIDEHVIKKGTENESGTGLGLLLCKEFVEKHDGRIWVESEIGKGSIFKFSIPIS